MNSQSDWPLHIQQRYGLTKRKKLPVLIALLIALVVGTGLGLAEFRKSHPSIHWELRAFQIESDTKVGVVWEVLRSENEPTYCVLRAQDINRMDVGYATVFIEPGEAFVVEEYSLATESAPVLAEVLGCSNKPEMRVPPANFPPGVKIPAQVAPGFAPTP